LSGCKQSFIHVGDRKEKSGGWIGFDVRGRTVRALWASYRGITKS